MTLSFTTAVANALLTSYGANLNTSGYLAIFGLYLADLPLDWFWLLP